MKTNLANCKRLYELSGWIATDYYYNADGNITEKTGLSPAYMNHPAYDSDYLLGKLPAEVKLIKFMSGENKERYQVSHHAVNKHYNIIQDTASDALCLLAIQLFENGVLKK